MYTYPYWEAAEICVEHRVVECSAFAPLPSLRSFTILHAVHEQGAVVSEVNSACRANRARDWPLLASLPIEWQPAKPEQLYSVCCRPPRTTAEVEKCLATCCGL